MNIGIIGGADGPTAIYISSGGELFAAVAVIILIAAFVIIRKVKKRKNKR